MALVVMNSSLEFQGRIVFIFVTIQTRCQCHVTHVWHICHNDFYMLIQIHGQTNRLPLFDIDWEVLARRATAESNRL